MPDQVPQLQLPAPLEISGDVFLDVFIHKSLGIGKDNQRLAVLGRIVLDLVVAEQIYQDTEIPTAEYEAKVREALQVSKIKAWNEHYKFKSRLARRNISEPLSDEDEKVLFQGYVGAAHIRYGQEVTKRWLLAIIYPSSQTIAQATHPLPASTRPPATTTGAIAEHVTVSMFNQRCQQERKGVKYIDMQEGSGHLTRWRVDREVNGVVKGSGEGSKKSDAMKEAVKQAWASCNFGPA